MTDSPLLPFIVLVGLVFAMGNGIGNPLAHSQPPPAPQYSTAPPAPQYSTAPPAPSLRSPSTNGAYNNGLIGQMIYEMRYDGGLSPETLNQAQLTLQQCQAIKFNHGSCS